MLQFFLNPWMLAGVAGIALPVIAHLLSRRKYDVVQWGAMQFLNPSRKTRRKLKLEELLLLLVRMAVVALLALAMARPWINSGFLTGYRSAGSRDVVIVIDGSNSMSRSDGLQTLHRRAIRRAEELLDTLGPGDTVALIDARDVPVSVIRSPLQDLTVVREHLQQIRPPAGAANLQRACEEAVGILGRCSNGTREVVVFTDRQRTGWAVASEVAWKRFDDVLQFPSVRPAVWVVDVAYGLSPLTKNVSLADVRLSRDLTVPGFPVNLQVPVTNSGPDSVTVPLRIEVNGQRVASMDDSITVAARSQATFSRAVRFDSEGTSLVTVEAVVPEDSISVDDKSHAALQVTSAIPVLLVESSLSLDETRWNTFFARLALTNPENKSPWIVARTVRATELRPAHLNDVSAVVLADVTTLPDEMPAALHEFAVRGNGIFLCLGEQTDEASFTKLYHSLFPALVPDRIRLADPEAAVPTTVAPYSLEAGWLNRFRERKGATLLQTPFEKWWLMKPATQDESELTASDDGQVDNPAEAAAATDSTSGPPVQAPAVIARLSTGDPWLLQSVCGRGTVLVMTTNLDTSMNGLAATPDYVPFLHEALFQMAASRVRRNVDFGEPLVAVLKNSADAAPEQQPKPADYEFVTPDGRKIRADVRTDETETIVTCAQTDFPGVYRLSDKQADTVLDAFVVNYDHTEDEPAELTADDKAQLRTNDRLRFVDPADQLAEAMYGNESRSELWAALLWVFLLLLMVEVWMTRRLVKKGHADTDTSVVLTQPAAGT